MELNLIRVKLTGEHYQPKGEDETIVTGIFWDTIHHRPCIQLYYPTAEKIDYIPLSELGSSKILGSVTILNSEVKDVNTHN